MSRPLVFLLLAAGTPALGYAPKLTFGRTAAHAANGLVAEPNNSVGQSLEASPEAIGVDGTVYMWMGKYLTAFRANGTIAWTFSPRGITYRGSFPALSADLGVVSCNFGEDLANPLKHLPDGYSPIVPSRGECGGRMGRRH